MGKRAKASGARFELKVRKDLESKNWIVSKWMNNVRYDKDYCGLIPAKHKFRGSGIPMAIGTGFPDFICFKQIIGIPTGYIIHGVEVKSNGRLKPEEKEKCSWLLKNKIFSKILIAKKIKVGRRVAVEYKEVEND